MNPTISAIKDRRDLGALIPSYLDDWGLSPSEFRVYAHIARRAGMGGECWEGTHGMARVCRMNRKTVAAAIARLEKLHIIKVTRRDGKTSQIVLTNSSDWKPYPKQTLPKTDPTQNRPYPNEAQVPYPNEAQVPYPNEAQVPYPNEAHEGIPFKGAPLRESQEGNPQSPRAGFVDEQPPVFFSNSTPVESQGLGSQKSFPVRQAAGGENAPPRDRLAEKMAAGGIARQVTQLYARYAATATVIGRSPGGRAKAAQAAAAVFCEGHIPQTFLDGFEALLELAKRKHQRGEEFIGFPSLARLIEDSSYGEAAIARLAAEERPEIVDPKGAADAAVIAGAMEMLRSNSKREQAAAAVPRRRAMTREEEDLLGMSQSLAISAAARADYRRQYEALAREQDAIAWGGAA